MSNFALQLKTEISRLAKKESRAETAALKKAVSQSRSEVVALKRRITALETTIGKLTKATPHAAAGSANPEDRSVRFRVDGFISLRKRLNLSAAELAKLVGVSAQSVYHWESGKSRPRASQVKAIAEIRKLGKKKIVAMLSSQ